MPCQPLEIEHLHAAACEMAEQIRLRRAGIPAELHELQAQRPGVERLGHQPPVCLVAALHDIGPPADLGQHPAERPRALPAAPAIDQRTPAAVMERQPRLDMRRRVAEHQRRADLAREERRLLLVDRADPRPLLVVQDRQVDGARHVVLLEFGRRAHVDDAVEAVVEDLIEGGRL